MKSFSVTAECNAAALRTVPPPGALPRDANVEEFVNQNCDASGGVRTPSGGTIALRQIDVQLQPDQ